MSGAPGEDGGAGGEPAPGRAPPERLSGAEERFERWRRTLGLAAGPLAFAVLLLAPLPLPAAAARLAAVLAWTLLWWITEAVPLPVTAVLGPALAVVAGVDGVGAMFAPFGDPIVFLFLGSFLLAEAMYASGLDRRVALAILGLPAVGRSPARVLAAFAGITFGLSMWLSNSATTAMVVPIGVSLLRTLAGPGADPTRLRYGTALMLAAAYASSIGGIATPVGSPPNLIALGQLRALAGVQVGFFQWMALALPIALVLLALLVLYLRFALPPDVGAIPAGELRRARATLGRWSAAERNVAVAFGLTVALWVLPGVIALGWGSECSFYRTIQKRLPESTVALLGAGLLFVLPVEWRARRFTLTWAQATRIDWGTLLLFGGGLSLGAAMFRTGLAEALGRGLVAATGARGPVGLTYLFAALALVVTETTSNTAAATMVCPLAIAAARAAGQSPVAPAVAAALAASMAFLLPVSTPPNAIVYGTGCVRVTAMLRHGAVLDLVALALLPAAVLALCGAAGW